MAISVFFLFFWDNLVIDDYSVWVNISLLHEVKNKIKADNYYCCCCILEMHMSVLNSYYAW